LTSALNASTAGMWWFLHTHLDRLLLVIVDVVNIVGVALLETKDDAPVRPDSNAPEVFKIALQAMQPEAGQFMSSGLRID